MASIIYICKATSVIDMTFDAAEKFCNSYKYGGFKIYEESDPIEVFEKIKNTPNRFEFSLEIDANGITRVCSADIYENGNKVAIVKKNLNPLSSIKRYIRLLSDEHVHNEPLTADKYMTFSK